MPAKNSKFLQIKHFVKVKLKPYHTHAVYMHAHVNTGADVNLMPQDMYIKLFNEDKLKHLKPSDIKLGVWGDDQLSLFSKCNIYLIHPDTKKPVKVTFYIADKLGSTLLSCATSLKLDLIKLHPRLGVQPPRAKIITSQADQTSPAAKRVTQARSCLMRCRAISGRTISQSSYSPIQRPLTAPYRSPIQKRTVSHRKMSQVSKWSGQWAEFIGTKISPIQLPCTGPIQASYSPIQNPLTAPYRSPVQGRTNDHTETRQVSKWSACQDKCSDTKINPVWLLHMGPIQVPYGPIQNPLTAPFRGDNFPIQHHKIHQSVQLNKQRKMHPLRPPEHSWQPTNSTANNMFTVYIYWKIQKQ